MHRAPPELRALALDRAPAATFGRLDFRGFYEALYELADHWAYGVSVPELDEFLRQIFEAITVTNKSSAAGQIKAHLRGLEYNYDTERYEFKDIDQIPLIDLNTKSSISCFSLY